MRACIPLAAMARGAALAALLLAALSCATASLYPSNGAVLSLTDADYKSKMKGLVLLELYAPCVPDPRRPLPRSAVVRAVAPSLPLPLTRAPRAAGAGTASRWRRSGRSWRARWTR